MAIVGVLGLTGSLLSRVPELLKALFHFVPEGTARRILFVTGLLHYFLSKLRAAKRIVKSWVKLTPVKSSSQVKTSYSVMPSGAANST